MAADKGGGGRRIPANLITGFLGSGKTTLVNRLLRERPGMAVLVNDSFVCYLIALPRPS